MADTGRSRTEAGRFGEYGLAFPPARAAAERQARRPPSHPCQRAVGQLVRPLRPVKAEDIPPLTLESSLFALAGRFRSRAAGPGASDKRRHLGAHGRSTTIA